MQRQPYKRIYLSPDEVPYLIGPRGETVNNIRRISEAKVRFDREMEQDYAEIKGTNFAIQKAISLIQEKRDTFKRSVPPIYVPKESQNSCFSAQIDLPVGASRLYQGAGRSVFDENAQYIRVEKNYLIIKCPTQQLLDQVVEQIKEKVKNFACVAIPAPVWAVGRIIGRQGDGITKITNQVLQQTGSYCLVFFPDVNQHDGIMSYAIVSSDDAKATQICANVIIARLAAITEQGGVICDMLPAGRFRLKQLEINSFSCQIYFSRLQSQQCTQIRILNGDLYENINYKSEIVPYTPIYVPQIQEKKSYVIDPEKQELVLPLPLVLETSIASPNAVSSLYLPNNVNFPINALQSPQKTQISQPVDRKFLVISANSSDLQSADFWKNLSVQAFNSLSNSFFSSSSSILDFCDVEFQAFPGKSVLMPKSDQTATSHQELSELLQKRELTSRFIAGVENQFYNHILRNSKLIFYWRINICQKMQICGKNEIWTRVQLEKPVSVLSKPTCENDLQLIEDINCGIQISRRAICVQIMVHLNGFIEGKTQDLLILLKSRPRDVNCERFDQYIKLVEKLDSDKCFVGQAYEDDEEEIRYGIASLELPGLIQPDIFNVDEEVLDGEKGDQVHAGPVKGLFGGNKNTKGQFISSVNLCLEQETANLVECRYRFHKNLAIQHTDVVDFGNGVEKKKFVICFQPNYGSFWGCEGVKNVGFDARDEDYGVKLRDFVNDCIDVVQ